MKSFTYCICSSLWRSNPVLLSGIFQGNICNQVEFILKDKCKEIIHRNLLDDNLVRIKAEQFIKLVKLNTQTLKVYPKES